MKKSKLIAIVLVISVLFSIMSVSAAAQTRSDSLGLSFSGNKATCECVYIANTSTSSVSVTLILWNGTTLVGSWSNSGTGDVTVRGSATVTSGVTYRLAAYIVVDGQPLPTIDKWGTCP